MCACDTEHVMNATMLQSKGTDEPGTGQEYNNAQNIGKASVDDSQTLLKNHDSSVPGHGVENDKDSVILTQSENDESDTDFATNEHNNSSDREDMIKKLENAYIQMYETLSDNMNSIKSELADVKTEIRKLPLKIQDMVRREHKSIGKSISDLNVALSDCECYREQISALTAHIKNQNREMWQLQRLLVSSHSDASGVSPTAPTMHRQGSLASETMAPNQTHTKRQVLSSPHGPSGHHPTPSGDHSTSPTMPTTPPYTQEVNGHHASTMAVGTPSTQFPQGQVSRLTTTVSPGHQPDLGQTSPMAAPPPSHHSHIRYQVPPSTLPTPQHGSAAAAAQRQVDAPKADPQQVGEVPSAAEQRAAVAPQSSSDNTSHTSSEDSDAHDDDDGFRQPRHRRTPRRTNYTDVILIGDSTIKYVDAPSQSTRGHPISTSSVNWYC